MVSFFPSQQGFLPGQSILQDYNFGLRWIWTAISVCVIRLVLSTCGNFCPLYLFNSSCVRTLLFSRHLECWDLTPSFSVSPSSMPLHSSRLCTVWSLTNICWIFLFLWEEREMDDKKWGYLRANPVPVLRKQLRRAYSANFVPFVSTAKENVLFGNESTWVEGKVTL